MGNVTNENRLDHELRRPSDDQQPAAEVTTPPGHRRRPVLDLALERRSREIDCATWAASSPRATSTTCTLSSWNSFLP
jgi:hypothetical protein